ncbi:hypothetical protein TSOC_008058 [Tetrabaena socialis]|uniref:Uncharacterized protein n=1 Tax=Tetrabaena socialis TaxID=47790 RepID=A0A2J7ZZG3_9CHLO|nr:hypothetical protein TSOC_008058 [Tetrabaena socialis]|eukprot:PNH05653.1 hypothetical protein TSOC_008058 [Tetrabaena socialis]
MCGRCSVRAPPLLTGPARHGGRISRVLQLGMGPGRRDAESGQVLLDLGRHLDVLEAVLLINRFPDANKGLMWFDKDTFSLAFALVGKAHCYNQVAVPPSGFFHWSPDKLLNKLTNTAGPGWLLGGFVQHLEDVPYVYGSAGTTSPPSSRGTTSPSSSRTTGAAAAPPGRPPRPGEALLAPLSGLVRPAFLHRTINKLRMDELPALVEVARAAAIAASGARGILINAGGSRYLTNLVVTLKVLRHHFNCSLPVEVMWQGPAEMDAATWASLQRSFGPLRGVDVQATPHPVEGLHGKRVDARSYTGKVFSLILSNFSQVLLLDADSLPLMDPAALFDDPRFVQFGR